MPYLTERLQYRDLPRRLLVLSDDRHNSDLLYDFFHYEGSRVDIVHQTSQLGRTLQQGYDCILLDMPMDRMAQLLPELFDKPEQTPVLVLTQQLSPMFMILCLQLGVSDYLVKPVSLDLLALKMSYIHRVNRLVRETEQRRKRLEKLVYDHHLNQNIAHNVYQSMLASFSSSLPYCEVAKVAAEEFSGDIFLSDTAPNGNIYLLLADATGHGLAAAIQILPLANIFKAMVVKGCDLSLMVYELNRRLFTSGLSDRFVSCCLVEINLHANELRVWNGGMPDALVFDQQDKLVHRFSSRHMALGALDAQAFSVESEVLSLDAGSHLVMLSDGLIEQRNQHGEWFGEARALAVFTSAAERERLAQRLNSALNGFLGHKEYADDITIAVTSLAEIRHRYQHTESQGQTHSMSQGRLESQIRICGQMLADTGLLHTYNQLLHNINLPENVRHRAYTVFTELYNNALDHGILRLPSKLKDDPDGFVNYLEQRDRLKAQLTDEDWIEVSVSVNGADKFLQLRVKDMGCGYALKQANAEDMPFGRGLKLVKSLCREVSISPPGNETTVTVKWEDNE